VELFLDAHDRPPKEIVLDLDGGAGPWPRWGRVSRPNDDPLHGHQEGRFYHLYYDCSCNLPLHVFCGAHLLAAKLRRADIDTSAGAVEEVARIVGQVRDSRTPREVREYATEFGIRPELRFNDLRGTKVTEMVWSGISVPDLAIRIGWKIETAAKILGVYAALNPGRVTAIALPVPARQDDATR
jgi:hypothetical protein